MENSQQSLIIDFKQTFGTEYGKRVLEHLKDVCICNPDRTCFVETSVNKTDFNLGAQWAINYIQCRINAKIQDTPQDCQTEPEPESERT
jgi:hypothetical protein